MAVASLIRIFRRWPFIACHALSAPYTQAFKFLQPGLALRKWPSLVLSAPCFMRPCDRPFVILQGYSICLEKIFGFSYDILPKTGQACLHYYALFCLNIQSLPFSCNNKTCFCNDCVVHFYADTSI